MASADLTVLRRRYVALAALRWLPTGLIVPSLVLLLSARGLSLASIGLLTALYSAATLLLELPTGALSDVVGRRPVLIAGAVTGAAATLVLALSTSTAAAAAAFGLMGLSRALESGSLQAWYVDSVHAVDPEADLTRGISRAGVAESAGLAVGALASGALVATAPLPATGAALIALSVPFLIKAVLAVVQVAAIAAWVREPGVARTTALSPRAGNAPGAAHAAREVPRAIARGVALAARRGTLRRLLVLTGALGAALSGIELLAPSHAANLLGGATAAAGPYAVLVTLGFAGSGAGSALAPLAARCAGRPSRAAAIATVVGAACLAAVSLPTPAAAAVAFIGFYLLLGIAAPLTEELMHRDVTAAERATVLSLNSMALQATAVAVTAGLGALAATTSVAIAFFTVAAVLALGALTLLKWPAADKPAAASATPTPTAA